jgi:signal transduction histidine kinase/CheY-like chemotaxis protein
MIPFRLKTALQLGTLVTIGLAVVVSVALALGFYFEGGTVPWIAFAVSATLGTLALVLAGMLYVVGSDISKRVRRLESAADMVRQGNLSASISMEGRDEVAQISGVFDEMLGGLRSYVQLIPAHQTLQDEMDKMRQTVTGLRTRNMEMSDSLQRLHRAQEQFTEKNRLGTMGKMVSTLTSEFAMSLAAIRQATDRAVHVAGADGRLASELESVRAVVMDAQEKQARLTSVLLESEARAVEPVDVASAISEALELSEAKWTSREPDAAVKVDTRVGKLPAIQGNRKELVELFTHLFFNAAEAMPQGGTLTVDAKAGKGIVAVTVSDTGVGMTPLTAKRCFLPFFSTKEGAAGIGLTLAQGIVCQHGGKIGIESQPESGTVVMVEFPVVSKPEAAPAVSQGPARPLSILFVEDDMWTREAIQRNLVADHHKVDVAENGAAAIEKIKTGAYDVIITDRSMPDSSGEEVAAEAKRVNARVPVVMLTGFGSLMRERGEKPANVDEVLGKPVKFPDLQRVLNTLTVSAP